jgi:hypothetical protein
MGFEGCFVFSYQRVEWLIQVRGDRNKQTVSIGESRMGGAYLVSVKSHVFHEEVSFLDPN